MSKLIQIDGHKVLAWVAALAIAVTMTPAAFMMQTDTASADTTSTASADTTLENPRVTESKTTWDCVYFGHYLQSKNNRGGYNNDPIKWRVLSVNGDEAFLLSNNNIDGGMCFNKNITHIMWENCAIRSWLNGYGPSANQEGTDFTSNNFINRAFTASERSAIFSKTIKTADNPQYKTKGGNDTVDKIFFLSIDEATNTSYGFSSSYKDSKTRDAVNTAYTASKPEMHQKGFTNPWWLRSPGKYHHHIAQADSDVNVYGCGVQYKFIACRPALYLNLKSDCWRYAGTVDSNGVVNEVYPTVEPASKEIKSIKAGKKKLTVFWETSNEDYDVQNTEFQIKASTSKSFEKSKTTTVYAKAGVTSKTIKKLKGNKKYYVKMRAYKTVDGQKYWSTWSNVKVKKTR